MLALVTYTKLAMLQGKGSTGEIKKRSETLTHAGNSEMARKPPPTTSPFVIEIMPSVYAGSSDCRKISEFPPVLDTDVEHA